MSSTSALLNFSASAGERDGGVADATPRVEKARALGRVASPKLVDGADPEVVVSPPAAPTEAWTPNAPRAFDSPKPTARLDASARRQAAPGDAIARESEPSARDARRTRERDAGVGGSDRRSLEQPERRVTYVNPSALDTHRLSSSARLQSHYPNSFTRSACARARLAPRNHPRGPLGSESLLRVELFALVVRGVRPLSRPARVPRLRAGQG